MFSRSVVRAAAPVRQSFRTYASEAGPFKSTTATPWIVGAAAVASGTAGYAFLGNRSVHAEAQSEAKKAFTGGDQGFIPLKLEHVEIYSHDTKKLRFALPEEDQVSGLNIASAVITKYTAPDEKKPTIRPYTPISDEDEKGYLDLLVKVYPKGAMSQHMHSMNPGQLLEFKGPIPKYPWSPNKHNHITLIAGGTGITPMYQLIRQIFKDPNDKTKVSLVFGNKTEKDILLKEDLEKLENEFPQRFRVFFTLDTPPESWPYGKGFITKELLQSVIPDPKSENIKVFVCGPPPLYKVLSGPKVSPTDQGELSGILKELGYSKDQVYKF